MLLLALLTACGTPDPPANGGMSEPPGNRGETLVGGADDGIWESLPIGARVQTGGYLDGAYDDGARVNINPHVCAHLAMTRAEWDRLLQTVRPNQRIIVHGRKAPRLRGGCLIQLDQVGIVAQ